MDFITVPAVIGCHNRLNTSAEGGNITFAMNISELCLRDFSISLIRPVRGPTITNKMLGGSYHPIGPKQMITACCPLESLNHFVHIRLHNFWILRVALITSSPAIIPNNSCDWREHPIDTSDGNLKRRDLPNLSNQVRIICSSQSNIMWENSGSYNIIMAMHRICSPNNWNANSTVTFVGACNKKTVR